MLFTLTYGALRTSQGIGEAGPVCASLQGNVEQNIRNEQLSAQAATNPYLLLSDSSIASNPDLIIWPETSYSREWYSISPEMKPEKSPRLESNYANPKDTWRRSKKRWNTSVLLGLNSQELTPSGVKRYNSALLVSNDENKTSRYDKIHRVPFGEFIPFKEVFPGSRTLHPMISNTVLFLGQGTPSSNSP